MKAIWIRSDEKTVTEVTYEGLPDLQRMVGGSIELAMRVGARDTLFVDEEGLHKYGTFFIVPKAHQPFAGNGVIVGPEYAGSSRTRDPKITLAEVTSTVRFMNRRDVSRQVGHG